jgi:hypothetical protein
MTTADSPATHTRVLLVAVWFLLGAPIVYYGAESIQGARSTWASRHWPQVTGTVVKYESRGRAFCARPVIHYAYVVNGKALESSARVPGKEECFLADVARSLAVSYPPGSSVRVYYNPQVPQKAALLPGHMTRNAWMGLLVFPTLLLGWFYGAKLLFKSRLIAPSVAQHLA